MRKKPRTYYQQIAAAVAFESKLEAKLTDVFRKHGKLHFTFKSTSNKEWTTTLSKLENYKHNKFKNKKQYWTYTEWQAAGEVSSNFDGYKLYIIECKHPKTSEMFFKVGRTFQTVNARFGQSFPYEYRVIHTITSTAYKICRMEEKILRDNKNIKYIPTIKFSGMYECFSAVPKGYKC